MPATKTDKKHILILEDQKQYSRVYILKLEAAGYEVKAISDACELEAELARKKPDLLLLDLILKDESGFDVLAKIKSNPKYKSVKVVIYSSLCQDSDMARAKDLGADDYLCKSEISLKELLEKIKSLI